MAKKADQVISIRVPQGLPDELRTYTNVPFSTLMRHMAVTLLNNERKKRQQPILPVPPLPTE